jgi:hypothetical protein
MYSFKAQLIIVFIFIAGFTHLFADDVAGDDKYIYKEDSIVIGPKVADPQLCYYWEPKELLNDNTLPNPVAKVSKTTTFALTVTGKDFTYAKTGSMTIHYVKVESISGLSSAVCQGREISIYANLTDNIELPDGWMLHWECKNGSFNKPVGTYVTAKFDAADDCDRVKCVISGAKDTAKKCATVIGFEIRKVDPDKPICDGSTVSLYISPVPAETPISSMGCFSNAGFTLSSEPTEQSFGNLVGNTTLTLTPLDANLHFEIQNAIWYATEPNYCNTNSYYKIWVKTKTTEGNDVSSEFELDVDATSECVQGYAPCCEKFFDGKPVINPVRMADSIWIIENFTKGTLTRAIKTKPIEIITNPNSQFYSYTFQEEEYHDKQWEGKVPSQCYENTYVVDSIIYNMNKNRSETVKLTKEEAVVAGEQLFLFCTLNEINRSNKMKDGRYCRCADEFDVKTFLNKIYLTSFFCTYETPCNGNDDNWMDPDPDEISKP